MFSYTLSKITTPQYHKTGEVCRDLSNYKGVTFPVNLIYQFSCPVCSESYIVIGKTVQNLGTRLAEHAKFRKLNSPHVNSEHAKLVLDSLNLYVSVNGLEPDKSSFEMRFHVFSSKNRIDLNIAKNRFVSTG